MSEQTMLQRESAATIRNQAFLIGGQVERLEVYIVTLQHPRLAELQDSICEQLEEMRRLANELIESVGSVE